MATRRCCPHSRISILRALVLASACGYEDANGLGVTICRIVQGHPQSRIEELPPCVYAA
jgi:hypothetical protein